MLRPHAHAARTGRGFSLIELMVAMVAGLILIGSVLGLVVANLQNNAATASGIRLTQESRAINEVITRELRRVRYNGLAVSGIGSGATPTTFDTLDVDTTAGCIKYAYDVNANGVAETGEFRMFSRTETGGVGVVRHGRFANAAAISCTGGEVISSSDINITALTFDDDVANRLNFTLGMSMLVDASTSQTSTRQTSGSVMIRSGDPIAP